MRRPSEILSVVFGYLALTVVVHGLDQSGFMSIDCGITPGFSYSDTTTEIYYFSDSEFIDTGVNYNVSEEYSSKFETHDQQFMDVRSFPEGAKNCYTLRPQGKDNYLIRASFMYGNYDSKNQLPTFKLYLGADEWDTVNIQNANDIIRKEIIYVPKTDDIYVCLVDTGSGTPFISALELRRLNDSIYTTQSGSLILFKRLDMGSRTSQIVRYKDDVFDRIWTPFNWPSGKSVSTSYSSNTLSDNSFKLPSMVMATAVTSADERYPLEFHWNLDNSTRQFYVYMHFAEVEELQSNQLREFYVSLNGWFWGPEPIVPGRLLPHTGFSTHSISASSELSFSIYKTSRSNLPPVLNALEIYEIKNLFQSSTVQSDVNALKKIKAVYEVKKNWQGDPCLPMEFSWDGVSCSDSSSSSPSIISLNLSWSKLTGKIDSSFSDLTSLKYLDLSYNSLTGEVPNFLSKLTALKTLNLSGNNLIGSVPLALIDKSRNGSLLLRLDGNPNLCKAISCDEEEGKEKEKKNVIDPVVASVTSVLVLLLGELAALWMWILKRRKQQHGDKTLESKNRHFSYSEIQRITENFKKLLGQGSSANVYHGHLSDGTEVAVKELAPSPFLGFRQFKTEAQLLTRVHHKNLVSIIGYCDEGSNKVLISEYMAKGNLKQYLSGQEVAVLSWEQRLQIAIDAAQALEYLHNGCDPPIIHGNVKTENILLNEKLQAKVADFGWSRSIPSEGENYVSTAIVGTPGYLSPEYQRTSVLDEKIDVYSFGIVLLEIISGQIAITKITKESPSNTTKWVHPIIAKGDMQMIVDPMLQGDFETDSVRRAVETAMSCILLSSTDRPNMRDVVLELKECLGMVIAHERTNSVKEDYGSVGIEGANERTDNVEEDHGPLGIEGAHERIDNAEDNQGHIGIEDNVEEDDGPLVAEGEEDDGPLVTEGEEDHGPLVIEGAHERTDNVEENLHPIKGVHERTNNVEEDHGPVGTEAAPKRTDNVEENHGPVGAAMAVQESMEGNLDFCETKSHQEAKEKARKRKKNVVVPTVASISSELQVPSGSIYTSEDQTFESKNQYLCYSEVERITENFQKLLGKGASAKVYHGHLRDGTEVAVKVLSPSSTQGFKQFKTEAELLTRVHHKKLVSLIGYCNEDSNMVLIYEYMAKGNLKEYLSGKRKAVLSWEQRLQIAIDAAQALEYLHTGCNPPIIHRDVKTENILLNEKLVAKVADFGWSRVVPSEGGSYVSTAIVGTPGYLDPEYHRTSVPNEKTDVYSFGIVLLELISGQPAIIKVTGKSPCNIADWFRSILAKEDINMIMDPRLKGEFESTSARRAVEIAMSCVPFSSTDRPTMSDVVVELKGCLKIKIAHERTNNVEEDIGPVGIETTVVLQESWDGEPYEFKTSLFEEVKEKQKKKKKKKNVIVPAVTSATSVTVPSGALGILGRLKKIWQHAPDKSSASSSAPDKSSAYLPAPEESSFCLPAPYKGFPYLPAPYEGSSEVETITYNSQKMIGGAYGNLYLGHLSDGTEVAIELVPSHDEGFEELLPEALEWSKIRHKNLVSLMGFWDVGGDLELAHEYMAVKSLEDYLSGKIEAVLIWEQRLQIAIDVAEGLEYLHGWNPPIIHGGVRPASILLNEDLEARVSDFRCYRNKPSKADAFKTRVFHESGYLDPGYYHTLKLSEKSNVYSFGIILLELISGQAPMEHALGRVRAMLDKGGKIRDRSKIRDILDPRLQGDFDLQSVVEAAETAAACAQWSSEMRPTMSQVLVKLKKCIQVAMDHHRRKYNLLS